MNPKRLPPVLFLILPTILFAQETKPNIAESLFSRIMNKRELDPFPFVPPVELPLGMTVHLLMLLIAAAVVFAFFAVSLRAGGQKPRGPAVLLELLVSFVRNDIVVPVMGDERGEKWLPFFSTLFVFILTVNLIGLIPAFEAATGDITVTTALAIMILVLIFVSGFRSAGFAGFFRGMYPQGAPIPIGLFVALLEFVGIFIRSLVLSIRLFANMLAGHLAILSFLVMMFVLHPLIGFISVPFAIFTYALEVLVAFIQAFVFTLLGCIFISMASGGHEPTEEHE